MDGRDFGIQMGSARLCACVRVCEQLAFQKPWCHCVPSEHHDIFLITTEYFAVLVRTFSELLPNLSADP